MSRTIIKLSLVLVMLSTTPVVAQSDRFESVDIQNSKFTCTVGINNSGTTVGTYVDANDVNHGFVRHQNGKFQILEPFGYSGDPAGINDRGVIVGNYFDGTVSHGFVYSDGVFKSYDAPAESSSFRLSGINNLGHIIGVAEFYDVDVSRKSFLLTPLGMTWIDSGFPATDATGINDVDVIVGNYGDFLGLNGFVRFPNGTYIDIYYPDSWRTWVYGINNRGQIAGVAYFDFGSVGEPFIYSGGKMIAVNIPFAQNGISLNGISNNSRITGCYQLSDYSAHGFVGRFKP